jgi:hypothetical protein
MAADKEASAAVLLNGESCRQKVKTAALILPVIKTQQGLKVLKRE